MPTADRLRSVCGLYAGAGRRLSESRSAVTGTDSVGSGRADLQLQPDEQLLH